MSCRYQKAPTFPEFVDYVLDTDVESYNEHWVPYYLLCTPCHLNYTVIAKTESIGDDSRLINKHLDDDPITDIQVHLRSPKTTWHWTVKGSERDADQDTSNG